MASSSLGFGSLRIILGKSLARTGDLTGLLKVDFHESNLRANYAHPRILWGDGRKNPIDGVNFTEIQGAGGSFWSIRG